MPELSALAVGRRVVGGQPLEVLFGGWLPAALRVQLGDRRDRWLKRQSTGPVWHDLVAPTADFNQLPNL